MTSASSIPLSQRYQLARAAGFPPADAVVMAAISMAECASCDMGTYNATGDSGLWQINKMHGYSLEAMSDPVQNAQAAYAVWKNAGGGIKGFQQWCTYPGGCGGQPGVPNFGTLLLQAASAAQQVDSAAPTQIDPSGSGASVPANPHPLPGVPGGAITPPGGTIFNPDGTSSSSANTFTLIPGYGAWPGVHISFGFLWAALFLIGGVAAIIVGLLVYFKKQVTEVAGKVGTAAAAAA